MALQLPPGRLEQFVGMFYKVNAKTPQARPEAMSAPVLHSLVITKGMLKVVLDSCEIDVNMRPDEQVEDAAYQASLSLLATQLAGLLQVPHYTQQISEALSRNGLRAFFDGPVLRMSPLSAGVGELDHY